jgi:antitoxin ParD1/3/4
MTITLTPEQLKWIEQQVASGKFGSVEDAVRLAVADLMAVDAGDLAWAKPLVDEARASIARGEGTAAKAVKAEFDAYLKSARDGASEYRPK